MKAAAFLKKEIKFYLSPARLLSVPLIFLLFALTSPVLARYTREIIGALEPDFVNLIPQPVLADSYLQFVKNIGQIGFLVMIIIFSASIVKEKEQGTAILMLTRPLRRGTFILMKYAGAFLYYTAAFVVSALAFLLYTYLMFQGLGYSPFLSMLTFYLYGLLFVCTTLMLSTLVKSTIPAAISGIAVYLVMGMVSAIPKLSEWLPTQLSVFTTTLATGAVDSGDFIKPLIITLALIAVCPVITVFCFKKQEL